MKPSLPQVPGQSCPHGLSHKEGGSSLLLRPSRVHACCIQGWYPLLGRSVLPSRGHTVLSILFATGYGETGPGPQHKMGVLATSEDVEFPQIVVPPHLSFALTRGSARLRGTSPFLDDLFVVFGPEKSSESEQDLFSTATFTGKGNVSGCQIAHISTLHIG